MSWLSGFFGASKEEMPPPPGPNAVVVDPMSKRSAGEIIEEELAKMNCEPSEQLKLVVERLKDPKYVMAGGRRRRRRHTRHGRKHRRHTRK